MTACGTVDLHRRYFWSKATGGVYPVDELLGIDGSCVSVGAAELCTLMGALQGFDKARWALEKTAGLRVSKERLRQITEQEADQVERLRKNGELAPNWTARQAAETPHARSRVYVGADGVMVRTVTQEEKQKRRKNHAIRRQQRGRAGLGNHTPLPPLRAGSDQAFKEMKVGVFYDQSKCRVHAFATEENAEGFGVLLKNQADQLELQDADEKISLTDGGPWIRNQFLEHLKYLDAMLLDFYHLSSHIWETARCCLGHGQEAETWASDQLSEIKNVGARSVIDAIDTLASRFRAQAKQDSLRKLKQYIIQRWEMVEYPQALARGWDIGSGPTEAMCKNLTLRLKRTGMKWDQDHAAGMMNLVALQESGQWDQYWRARARRAG